MLLNTRARAWTDSSEGKQYQKFIFKFLYSWRKSQLSYQEGKYDWMSRNWIESKLKEEQPGIHHEKLLAALYRLQEHGYVIHKSLEIQNDYGSGVLVNIRITEQGWQNWEKCHQKGAAS